MSKPSFYPRQIESRIAEEVQRSRTRFGSVLESFVYGELMKSTTTAEGEYTLMYYRDADKVEVDLVIENAAGHLVGVEVKSSATIQYTLVA